MRTRQLRLFTSVIALLLSTESLVQAQSEGWFGSFEEARTAASGRSLPLLIHFHAWYCGPCQRMDREVFSDHQVQQALSLDLASVKIDVTQEPDLASRYGVQTVPCDVVVYPDGSSEKLGTGFVSRVSYLALLQTAVVNGHRRLPPRPAATPESGRTGSNPAVAGVSAASTTPAAGTNPDLAIVLGLEGFCPVRLMNRREWTPGKAEFTAEHRGIQYQFSGAAEREEFLKNPNEFAPQDLGCDPVVLTESQRAVMGSIRFGAFFDNRLYLFETAENRNEFRESPLRFSRVRSALNTAEIQESTIQ